MKISYKHLVKSIYEKPSIDEISQKLFQLGHENEIFDDILDIDITPNRGDCLSIRGILRELKVFYTIDIYKEIYDLDIEEFQFDFINNSEEHCPYISFLHVEVDDIPSVYSSFLSEYFDDLEVKKTNFFTDISNYISYETGQPTHCYDYNKLVKNKLSLDLNDKENSFKTLLGKELQLTDTNLVFTNEDGEIINLAGVMGGESTACSVDTKSVIIECAFFNPEIIIGKSLKYDIKSDASYKFERGTDPKCHDEVLRRFLKIVNEHSGIKNAAIFRSNKKEFENRIISFDHKTINKIIGTDLSKNQMNDYFIKLGFEINKDKSLKIPSYRNDINTINDLSEEIARCFGYDKIALNDVDINFAHSNTNQNKDVNKLKNFLIGNGFYEVINNPFSKIEHKDSIIVDNPLDSKRKHLRTSLKDSLIQNLLFNERRQKDSIKLFEISNIYSSNNNNGEQYIGIIASGRVGNNYKDFSKKINLEYISKTLSNLFSDKIFEPQKIDRQSLDTKNKNDIIYLEMKINEILNENIDHVETDYSPKIFNQYKLISDYPSSIRDISFSVQNANDYIKLERLIMDFTHQILKEVFIFDFYSNQKKNEIKIGFRFVFQSKSSTLTDLEVNEVINNIISKSLSIGSVSIPGL